MKNKYAKVEGHSELIRDEMSHAIINMDDEAYRLTIRRREMMKSQKNEINLRILYDKTNSMEDKYLREQFSIG